MFFPTGPTTSSISSPSLFSPTPTFIPSGPSSTFVPTGPTSTFIPTGPTSTFIPTGPTYTTYSSDPFLSSDIFTPLSPYPLTINFDFDKPLLGFYETIDNYPEVQRKMIKYYYDLVRDQWLLDELNDILNYYTYSDGNVRLIKSMSDYRPQNISKDTDKIAEKKVEYIEDTILTKYDMADILIKFVKDMHVKFVDLPKHEFLLRQAVKEYLMKQIRKKMRKE